MLDALTGATPVTIAKPASLDFTKQAMISVQRTLAKYSMSEKADDIVQTYDDVNEVLKELDDLHSAII